MAETTAPPARRRSSASLRSEARFRARLQELGATLLEPVYLGSNRPHRVRCAVGHECNPWPADLARGRGLCKTCAGQDPKAAEAAFRARVEELGGIVLDTAWEGVRARYRIRCAAGHEATPRAQDVRARGGICATCANVDPRAAEARFRSRLAALGAVLLDQAWRGANTTYRVQCAGGHEVRVRPGNISHGGFCNLCFGRSPKDNLARLRALVERHGGTLLETSWKGSLAPHRIRCPKGHLNAPWACSVFKGGSICRTCSGKQWDVLYVVRDDVEDVVKFGITSGDPRPRLYDHARDGLDTVVRLHTGLPGGTAPELERIILGALRDAGERPTRGREYFPARVLPLILDLVDHHPAVRATNAGTVTG